MWYHLYLELKESGTNFFYETETESQMQKLNLLLPKAGSGEGKLGDWD